jgi:hypothetical protein
MTTPIADIDLARLMHRRGDPLPPGEYESPGAQATWDGQTLSLRPTGTPLAPEVAAKWPRFARMLTLSRPATDPTIEALSADYAAATTGRAGVAAQSTFAARLPRCRACELWNEAGRGGRGSCASVRAACACRRLWRADEVCPEGKWP